MMTMNSWLGRTLGATAALVMTLAVAGCSGDSNSPPVDAGDGATGGDAGNMPGDTGDSGPPPPAGVVAAGVRWVGRVDTTDPAAPRFSWSGTGFIAQFSGTALTARLVSNAAVIFKAVVDGTPQPAFTAAAAASDYPLATALPAGAHTVELYRQTEGAQGYSQLLGLTVGDGVLLDPPAGPQRLIEVIGDSISAGYGTLGTNADTNCFPTESHWDAYPAVMARALGAEVSTIAASGRGVFRNYGGDSVDTVPMIYDRILANNNPPTWDFHIQPHAVIINLGTNDVAKGDPGMPFQDTYQTLLETVRGHYPDAYIVCTIGPLTSTAQSSALLGYIRAAVQARTDAGDTHVEVYSGIAPQTMDKWACQAHPNPAEQAIVAGQLADELRAKLGW